MSSNLQINIRALRIILTCFILFILTWYFQIPERAWSLITICFVMLEYTYVGGVFLKSIMRFFGTFIAAVYGLLIVYSCKNDVVINMIGLIPGVFFYMYYFLNKKDTYIAVIGCVTLVIVLLNHNDVGASIIRTFNISIGILGSLIMMLIFYPEYARDEVIQSQSRFIGQLIDTLDTYLNASNTLTIIRDNCVTNEKKFTSALSSFDTLLNESKIETLKTPFFVAYNLMALKRITHIYQLINWYMNQVLTDEIRAEIGVHEDVVTIRACLAGIQQRLDNRGGIQANKSTPSCCNTYMPSIPYNEQTNALVSPIFSTIKDEMLVLDKALRKMVLLYGRYA